MPESEVMAVILGGGRGTRLYPLTKLRAKPAVPLAGRYRLIDIPVSNCINSGFTRIFILTQFLSVSLHRHVFQTYKFDNFSAGFVEILAAEQTLESTDWYQGTADAVRKQLHHLSTRNPDDVLILSGDHLYRMDYTGFLEFHRETCADVTIAVMPVTAGDASRYGILKTDGDRISTFREKPRGAELKGLESRSGDRPYLASMGIYLFRLEVLEHLLDAVSGDDFGKHVIPAAFASGDAYAFPFEGYWEDIGTIVTFYEANLALTLPDPPFDFYDPTRPIYTHPRFLPPSRVDGCRLEHAVVADGCKLYDADIEECVIGLRSVIRPGARLSQVVMMGADFFEDGHWRAESRDRSQLPIGIGEGSSIERAIIDKNARIGKDVTIRSHQGEPDREEEQYVIRDGIVVIPKNTEIPDGTTI
ncbi:MAG: glucose-1-phosphate adenylyltransferase [Anaerolineae bacterium]|jgi:glucose-1-phosphate adenylyltransferase